MNRYKMIRKSSRYPDLFFDKHVFMPSYVAFKIEADHHPLRKSRIKFIYVFGYRLRGSL